MLRRIWCLVVTLVVLLGGSSLPAGATQRINEGASNKVKVQQNKNKKKGKKGKKNKNKKKVNQNKKNKVIP